MVQGKDSRPMWWGLRSTVDLGGMVPRDAGADLEVTSHVWSVGTDKEAAFRG